ncbi:DUF333 domain-containing protein [Vibrio hannami]|uniref:putative hemolysin n=1 Tax=Vibrio hannami TaxID=2717094 RepID=UPI0024101213|nr:DUF333 domain-containing protein [Vibrio hannami]MDG3086499.1 DUF333 domain-containing protein [Vibrio hannami]
MKNIKLLSLAILTVGVVGCSQDTSEKPIGMANPASEYCAEVGGESIIKETEDGQLGYCKLEDGVLIDEWDLYRSRKEK